MMKKITLLIILFFVLANVKSQSYVFEDCLTTCDIPTGSGGEPKDIIKSNDNNGFIYLFYPGLYSYIGKFDSLGNESWRVEYTNPQPIFHVYGPVNDTNIYKSLIYSNITSFGNHGYFVEGKSIIDTSVTNHITQAGVYSSHKEINVLSGISNSGEPLWTKEFSLPAFTINGIEYNQNSYSLLVYGSDSNRLKIIKFDSSGNFNWSKTLPELNYLTSCSPLNNGNFLFCAADSNQLIAFKIDPFSNISNSISYNFNQTIYPIKVLNFGDKYLLISSADYFHFIFCDSSGQILWSSKMDLTSYYNIDAINWHNNYFNLFYRSDDNCSTVSIDTNGTVFGHQYSGYLDWYSWAHGNTSTYLLRVIQDKVGMVVLKNIYFQDWYFGMYRNTTKFNQLDSLGTTCQLGTPLQLPPLTTTSIPYSPISISFSANVIATAPHATIFSQISPEYALDCSGFANIDKVQNDNSISIYPNPSSEYLTLKFTQNTTKATIKIYNLLGELKFISTMSSPETTIDIADLAKGVYIVEVATEKNIMREKFVKE